MSPSSSSSVSRGEAERALRAAGRGVVSLVAEIMGRADWDDTDLWSAAVAPGIDALQALLDALDVAKFHSHDDATRLAAVRKGLPPPPDADMVSLAELRACYTMVEVVAAWGIAPLVDVGLRPLERRAAKAAALPRVKVVRYTQNREERLERCFQLLLEILRAGPLAPLTARFVADALAASLQLDEMGNKKRAEVLLETTALRLVTNALREVLGGVADSERKVSPPPKWCSERCGALLGVISRRSVEAVLAEFAGDDELSAATASEAGNVLEARLASAVASSCKDNIDALKDVAPQLVTVVRENARLPGEQQPGEDANKNAAHGRVALAALGIVLEDGASVAVIRDACCPYLSNGRCCDAETIRAELCNLASLLCATAPPPRLALAFSDSLELWSNLGRLYRFATRSKRSSDAKAALLCLGGLARAQKPSFELAAAQILTFHNDENSFASSADGGIELVKESAEDDEPTEVVAMIAALGEPDLAGAVFASCLEAYLNREQEVLIPRLMLAAKMATALDNSTLEVSGVALLDSLRLVLEKSASSKEAERDEALEQIALCSVLAVADFGSMERTEDEEAALWKMLPSLQTLATPHRESRELASLAADCGVRLVARRCKPKVVVKEAKTTSDVLGESLLGLLSKEPPERAYAVVQLSKLAKKLTAQRDALRVLDRDADTLRLAEWRNLAAAFVVALKDNESYVFLAAIHGLADLCDAEPLQVLPWLCDCHETGQVEEEKMSEVVCARLGEALVTSVKRRDAGAIAQYASKLAQSFLRGCKRGSVHRASCISCLAELIAVAKHGLGPAAVLDVIDLVGGILKHEDEPQVCRRAAAYLAYRALSGTAALELVKEAPRETARLCGTLKRLLPAETDLPTKDFALRALDSIGDVIEPLLQAPDRRIELPLERDDWLCAPRRP